MNFYSHLAIASVFTSDANIALGVMLPDFAGILGIRQPHTTDPGIRKGYELHHATDHEFHEHALFRQACVSEAALLRAMGVARGTCMAAAHVGLEFCLDDALSEDGPARSLYRQTLTAAVPATLSRSIGWRSPEQADSFEMLRRRLLDLPPHRHSRSLPELADRICRTLSRRPRLAVRADDQTRLEIWAAEVPSRNATIWPIVTDSVTSGLERAKWHIEDCCVRSLRFRRARGDEV